jgi:hypothetical protein
MLRDMVVADAISSCIALLQIGRSRSRASSMTEWTCHGMFRLPMTRATIEQAA